MAIVDRGSCRKHSYKGVPRYVGYTGCVPLVLSHSYVAEIVAAICHIKKLDFDLIAHPSGLPFSTYAMHGCCNSMSHALRALCNLCVCTIGKKFKCTYWIAPYAEFHEKHDWHLFYVWWPEVGEIFLSFI